MWAVWGGMWGYESSKQPGEMPVLWTPATPAATYAIRPRDIRGCELLIAARRPATQWFGLRRTSELPNSVSSPSGFLPTDFGVIV